MSPHGSRSIEAPPFTNREIREFAEAIATIYVRKVGLPHVLSHGLNFYDVYDEVIYPEFEIEIEEDHDLGEDEDGRPLLGAYDVENNVVRIDRIVSPTSNDPRRVFTLWHEVGGHAVLQGNWLRSELARLDVTSVAILTEMVDGILLEELERQANLFASHAAAPTWLVQEAIWHTFRPSKPLRFFEPCDYWLDVHGTSVRRRVETFLELCRFVASQIQPIFGGLSKEALSYRVETCGILQNLSGMPRRPSQSGLTLRRVAPRGGVLVPA